MDTDKFRYIFVCLCLPLANLMFELQHEGIWSGVWLMLWAKIRNGIRFRSGKVRESGRDFSGCFFPFLCCY